MDERIERELDWDDIIEHDGNDWVLLPEGVYPFTVTNMERKRFNGSAKLPPCLQAELTLRINGGEKGVATITHNLFLHSKTEGLLCAFFAAIGMRKKGEALRMDWTKVVGASGLCEVSIRDWTDRDGNARQSNQVKKFVIQEFPIQPQDFAIQENRKPTEEANSRETDVGKQEAAGARLAAATSRWVRGSF